jgi:hypothetical protein
LAAGRSRHAIDGSVCLVLVVVDDLVDVVDVVDVVDDAWVVPCSFVGGRRRNEVMQPTTSLGSET